jgi:hypothetical protein
MYLKIFYKSLALCFTWLVCYVSLDSNRVYRTLANGGLGVTSLGNYNNMMVQSKKYLIRISKEKFLHNLKNKFRLPAEDIWYHPFMNKDCEWITGKIENNSFLVSDYRFPKNGIKFGGKIIERMNEIEVSTEIYFKTSLIIIQSSFLVLFILMFYLSDNVFARLSLLFVTIVGGVGNYLIMSAIIKGFYRFFENLLREGNLIVEDNQ